MKLIRDYAFAVHLVAEEEQNMSRWNKFLCFCSSVINSDEIQNLVEKGADQGDIAEIVYRMYEDHHVCFKNFLNLLVVDNALTYISDIQEYFWKMLVDQSNILYIRSPIPLREEMIKKIQLKMEKKYHTCMHVKFDIDESLIGGIHLKFKDTIIDASIKSNLHKLLQE